MNEIRKGDLVSYHRPGDDYRVMKVYGEFAVIRCEATGYTVRGVRLTVLRRLPQ